MTRRASPKAVLENAAVMIRTDSFVGVGVDLVDVTAMTDLLDGGGAAFLNACWTDVEQHDAEGSPARLAARWAAKEAVMKVLGKGIGDVDPLDIEIISAATGAPSVRLTREAAARAETLGVVRVHVSMTHESQWAAAIAAAEVQTIQQNLEVSE